MRPSASGVQAGGLTEDAPRSLAFRQLSERHLDRSYRLANVILRNPSEAEDAVHDAFVTAWRKWDSLRELDRFEAWFRRIVVNTCRDRLRRRGRIAVLDVAEHHTLATSDHAAMVDQRVLLEGALRSLKPDDQVLIVLRYDRDLRLEDIAGLLDIPTGTVKRRLHDAHRRLRHALARSEGQR
jgi:RNA polymerase sigma-70 factor (ECF subfamily)